MASQRRRRTVRKLPRSVWASRQASQTQAQRRTTYPNNNAKSNEPHDLSNAVLYALRPSECHALLHIHSAACAVLNHTPSPQSETSFGLALASQGLQRATPGPVDWFNMFAKSALPRDVSSGRSRSGPALGVALAR